MQAKDAISGKSAECFVTIGKKRYNFMSATKIEVNFDKQKAEIPILGKTGTGHKSTGWNGTGTATFHYNVPIFRKMMISFRDGTDVYFDMQIINNDKTSDAGKQEVILEGCNIDGGILAKFDAEADYLDEDMDFTFENFRIPNQFNLLKGM